MSLTGSHTPSTETSVYGLARDYLNQGFALYVSDLSGARQLFEQAVHQANLEQLWNVKAEALIALGKAYRDLGEPHLALEALGQALELTDNEDQKVMRADVLNQRAGVQHNLGEYALALRDLEGSLEIARVWADDRRVASGLINMGILQTKLADYPRALATLREAHKLIRESLQDSALEGQCLINLALVYEDMGDNQKSLETCQVALETVRSLENRLLLAITTVNLGYAQKRIGFDHLALQSFQSALELARDLKLLKVEIAALDGLGQVYASSGDVNKALEVHHLALARARASDDAEGEIDALLSLARGYKLTGGSELLLKMAAEALALAQQVDRKKSVIEAHELLSLGYEALQQPQQALIHYRVFHQLEKRLFNEERESKSRQLAIQFELERAQYHAQAYRIRTEIEREARERAEAMVTLRTQELVESNHTIAQQRQQLQEKVIELGELLSQNEILRQRLMLAAQRNTALNEAFLRRLSAELHDGPAQDLGYVVLKLGSGHLEAAVDFLPKTHKQAYRQELEMVQTSISRALNEMRAIAGGMCLPELTPLSITETVMRAINNYQRRTQTEVEFDFEVTFSQVALPIKITVYRLVQESLMNGFKHSSAREQLVRMHTDQTQLRLEVSDQGQGFVLEDTLAYNGRLGLLGMRERVESLGGTFSVRTAPGQGTSIQAVIPLTS